MIHPHDAGARHADPKLSIRVSEANRLHHLWNNHGTWWVHFTEHLPDFTKRRVRRSLRTSEETIAIRLRDELLAGRPTRCP